MYHISELFYTRSELVYFRHDSSRWSQLVAQTSRCTHTASASQALDRLQPTYGTENLAGGSSNGTAPAHDLGSGHQATDPDDETIDLLEDARRMCCMISLLQIPSSGWVLRDLALVRTFIKVGSVLSSCTNVQAYFGKI